MLYVIIALFALLILSLYMPQITTKLNKWYMKRTYMSLRNDIIQNGHEDPEHYRTLIRQFNNTFTGTPGSSGYFIMLQEYLNQATEIDFRKELGI